MPKAIESALRLATTKGRTYYVVPTRFGLRPSEVPAVGPESFYEVRSDGSVFLSQSSPEGRTLSQKVEATR